MAVSLSLIVFLLSTSFFHVREKVESLEKIAEAPRYSRTFYVFGGVNEDPKNVKVELYRFHRSSYVYETSRGNYTFTDEEPHVLRYTYHETLYSKRTVTYRYTLEADGRLVEASGSRVVAYTNRSIEVEQRHGDCVLRSRLEFTNDSVKSSARLMNPGCAKTFRIVLVVEHGELKPTMKLREPVVFRVNENVTVTQFSTATAPAPNLQEYNITEVFLEANVTYFGEELLYTNPELGASSKLYVGWFDEGVAEVRNLGDEAHIYFTRNDVEIDPYLYVVNPSTVTVNWGSTGDKTLLTITDNLPAGNKIVLFAVGWDAAQVSAQGYLKIVSGGTTLVQEGITHFLNYGDMRAKHVMLFAYHTNAPTNAQYNFIATVTAVATGSSTLHVQGMVILLTEPAFFTTGINTNIANGATVTLATVNTNFPAGSKVAVLAYVQMGVTSTTGSNRIYAAGNIRILRGSTIVSQNQFQVGTYRSIEPSLVSLIYLDASSEANPSYNIQVYNSLSETSQAWGEIIAFRVGDGAFLDTDSVALTNGSQVTVGNLSTNLGSEVGVIALAAAGNTGSSDVTAFNAGDVVLQLNNQATGQVANQRGWLLEQTSYSGRSGVYSLFRVDTGVFNPSYQVKMTARASGINGEAKILAFGFARWWHVTVRYVVAEGGRAPEGDIILRYYLGNSLQRLVLSSSYQTIAVDNGSVINADFISSGSNQYERWAYEGGSNFTMTITSDVTLDLLYYNQLSVTLIPVTSKPYSSKTSPQNYAQVNVTAFGTVFTLSVWENDTLVSAWVDRGGNVAWSMTTSGSTSTHRWATPGAVTLEGVNSPGASTATYYEQFKVTWRLEKNRPNITSTTSTNYFTAFGQQFNGSLTLTGLYTGHDLTEWIDYLSAIHVSELSSASTDSHRWFSFGESYTISESGIYYFKYEEYVRARIGNVYDCGGDYDLVRSGAVDRIRLRNPFNNTLLEVSPGFSGYFYYNAALDVVSVKWRGIWITERLKTFNKVIPTTPDTTYNISVPWIYAGADLDNTRFEIYFNSSAELYSAIWASDFQTLYVFASSPNVPGQTYLYYGAVGSLPKYVLYGGEELTAQVVKYDPAQMVLKLPFSGGTFVFDFSGKLKEQAKVYQTVYYPPQAIVTIAQPYSSPIVIPTINLTSVLKPVLSAYAYVSGIFDKYSPIPSSIVFPLLGLAAIFALIYRGMKALASKASGQEVPEGKRIYVYRERYPSFKTYIVMGLIFTVVTQTLIYYVLPMVVPGFARPNIPYLLFLAVIAIIFLIISVIVYLASSSERGFWVEARER
ncbi:MAG: hypothetical protein QXW42_04155 [Thermofilum sp.]